MMVRLVARRPWRPDVTHPRRRFRPGVGAAAACAVLACAATQACSSDGPGSETRATRRRPTPAVPAALDGVPEIVARPIDDPGEAPPPPHPEATLEAPRARPPVDVAPVATCALPAPPREAVREHLDLAYGGAEGRALRLDLVVPATAGPHPLVVLIHGGGWRAGERAHLGAETRVLAGLGYAAATVDYRLAPPPFPAAVADVRCALRFLRVSAPAHDVDPDRVAVIGFSAGGHLAALAAYAPEVAALDEACVASAPVSVRAVGAWFAPLDLRPEAGWPAPSARMIDRFLGVPAAEDLTRAALASPISHVDPADPATLLVHAIGDPVVPIAQSRALRDALERAGVPVTLVELPGDLHGFSLFTGRPELRPGPCTALAFLAAALGAPGGT